MFPSRQELTLKEVKTENPAQRQQQQQRRQQALRSQDQESDYESIHYQFSDQPQMAIHMLETENIPQQVENV